MSQADSVLNELRIAGRRGVHSFQLRALYIANPSQRIAELEARGHLITHTREKLTGAATGSRYKLIRDAEAPAREQERQSGPAEDSTGGDLNASEPLFEMPARQPGFDETIPPRTAILDEDVAA